MVAEDQCGAGVYTGLVIGWVAFATLAIAVAGHLVLQRRRVVGTGGKGADNNELLGSAE